MMLRRLFAFIDCIVVCVALLGTSTAAMADGDVAIADSPYVPAGYSYRWGDEFNGSNLDTSKWSLLDWGQAGGVATNNPRNIYMQSGVLHMVTTMGENGKVQRPMGIASISSPQRDSALDQSVLFAWRYGYAEIRAKVSYSDGSWPAWWMKSNTDMPSRTEHGYFAETDIMEACNTVDDKTTCGNGQISSTLHKWYIDDAQGKEYSAASMKAAKGSGSLSDGDGEWAVFGFLWTPNSMTSYVNGRQIAQFDITDAGNFNPSIVTGTNQKGMDAFQDPAYFILNGGAVAGDHVNTEKLPFDAQFDYIRVYGDANTSVYTTPSMSKSCKLDVIKDEHFKEEDMFSGSPKLYYTVSNPPSGVKFNTSTGVISGAIGSIGSSQFDVHAKTDAGSLIAHCVITVLGRPSSVTFNSNDESHSTVVINGREEDPLELNVKDFQNGDLELVGWNTQADGKGQEWHAKQSITMPSTPLTLYAEWKFPISETLLIMMLWATCLVTRLVRKYKKKIAQR